MNLKRPGGGGIEFAGDLGGGGGVVDEGGAHLHAGESAVAPRVTARRSLSLPTQHITKSWPSAADLGVAAVLPPNFSARPWPWPRTVEHRDLVGHLFSQMSCHGKTHHAETEKSDFSHVCNPGVCRPWTGRTVFWERGGGPARCARPVPLRMWNGHHKPWPTKGNGRVWRAGGVLC